MFYQLFGNPLAQSSWHIQLTNHKRLKTKSHFAVCLQSGPSSVGKSLCSTQPELWLLPCELRICLQDGSPSQFSSQGWLLAGRSPEDSGDLSLSLWRHLHVSWVSSQHGGWVQEWLNRYSQRELFLSLCSLGGHIDSIALTVIKATQLQGEETQTSFLNRSGKLL